MDREALKSTLYRVAQGSLSPDDAVRQMNDPPPSDETLLDISVASDTNNQTATKPNSINPSAPTRVLLREETVGDVGHYRILKEHARGGMGRILLALDLNVGRKVALKELISGLVQGQSAASAGTHSVGERFLREAKVTGRLEHPNIVPVYEIGEGENGSFYTMRFIEGQTLAQRLAEVNKLDSKKERLKARLQLLTPTARESFIEILNRRI